MKHTAVILLLVLLLLQTGGYYVITSIDILEAKREALNFIQNADKDEEDITTLTFPVRDGKVIASGLIFDDEDEFTYQDKMYDVISSEKDKDQITFKCYTDNKETELTQNLRDKIDSNKDAPAQKQKGTSLLKMQLQYTVALQEGFCFNPLKGITYPIIYPDIHQSYIYRAIVSPPPEFTLV